MRGPRFRFERIRNSPTRKQRFPLQSGCDGRSTAPAVFAFFSDTSACIRKTTDSELRSFTRHSLLRSPASLLRLPPLGIRPRHEEDKFSGFFRPNCVAIDPKSSPPRFTRSTLVVGEEKKGPSQGYKIVPGGVCWCGRLCTFSIHITTMKVDGKPGLASR